jgi:hypothetical protein
MWLALLGCCLRTGASAGADEAFELVPAQSPAQLLPASIVAGTNFHVVDPVQGDGLMNRFVVDSRFGTFQAYGRLALAKRVGEVGALTELSKQSGVELIAGGAERGVESEVKTALGVVTNPIGTVGGIPRGIAHLFNGYTARGHEVATDIQGSASSSGKPAGTAQDDLNKGEKAAKSYADRYLGVTSAELALYKRLSVDPYTDNTVLRGAIHKAAKMEAAGGFGVIRGTAGHSGNRYTQRAVDAIYKRSAAVRQRMRKILAGYGLSARKSKRG